MLRDPAFWILEGPSPQLGRRYFNNAISGAASSVPSFGACAAGVDLDFGDHWPWCVLFEHWGDSVRLRPLHLLNGIKAMLAFGCSHWTSHRQSGSVARPRRNPWDHWADILQFESKKKRHWTCQQNVNFIVCGWSSYRTKGIEHPAYWFLVCEVKPFWSLSHFCASALGLDKWFVHPHHWLAVWSFKQNRTASWEVAGVLAAELQPLELARCRGRALLLCVKSSARSLQMRSGQGWFFAVLGNPPIRNHVTISLERAAGMMLINTLI